MTVKHIKRNSLIQGFLIVCLVFLSFFSFLSPASASIDDDRLDGNIFVVYAGNGSLVPSKITLAESLKRQRPAIIVYYMDDSRDCKQYAIVVSRLQEFYGRAATIIPVSVDSIPWKDTFSTNEVGYYYNQTAIPQTVILDQQGKVVFDDYGQIPYEKMDDVLRKVFDLLPREESVELKRRSFNEFNSEIVN